jgi:chromosome segregation ATPase
MDLLVKRNTELEASARAESEKMEEQRKKIEILLSEHKTDAESIAKRGVELENEKKRLNEVEKQLDEKRESKKRLDEVEKQLDEKRESKRKGRNSIGDNHMISVISSFDTYERSSESKFTFG